jgi:hypothetical protein
MLSGEKFIFPSFGSFRRARFGFPACFARAVPLKLTVNQ